PYISSEFAEYVGPFYVNRSTDPPSFGLRLEAHHANTTGTAHGGILATLADLVLGQGLKHRAPEVPLVTVGLTIDYAYPVTVPAWLDGQANIQRQSQSIALANCYLMSDGRRVARASGIYVTPRT